MQHYTKVIGKILLTLVIHQNVINKHNDKQFQKLIEYPIHDIHKCCRGIG